MEPAGLRSGVRDVFPGLDRRTRAVDSRERGPSGGVTRGMDEEVPEPTSRVPHQIPG